MRSSLLLLAAFMPGALLAGTSASYTLDPHANASGGEQGCSANYSLSGSTTHGGQGTSSNYTSRGGYAGQLGFAQEILLSATFPTLAEGQSMQLSAEMSYDDGTSVPLSPSELSWEVESGPISSVSVSGVATASIVYQDSQATVQASGSGLVGSFNLTVLDVDRDNYGSYAGDRLPDPWQISHFGLNTPRAGQDDDFDADGIVNLIEFAHGTNPANLKSGVHPLRMSGGALASPGVPVIEYAPAPNVLPHRMLFIRRKDAADLNLNYLPQFSRNLSAWSNATTPVTVIADDGTYEVLSVRFPVLIGGQRSSSKFFRLNLAFSPP